MKPISLRHKIAATSIEMSSANIGVSVTARKYFRRANPEFAHMPNAQLNEEIATEFAKATPVYRFKLRSGEIAEVRESMGHFMIAAVRGRGTANVRYDIIVVQPSFKPVREEIKKQRLQPGWGAE
jgi:hypothetical protein